MTIKDLVAATANKLIVSAERYRKDGLHIQAKFSEEYAEALREKYKLPPDRPIIHRFLTLLSEIEDARRVDPLRAEGLNQYLNTTIRHLFEGVARIKEREEFVRGPKEPQKITAAQIQTTDLIFVHPDTLVSTALDRIVNYDITQLPVLGNGVGGQSFRLLTSRNILQKKITENGRLLWKTVEEVLPPEAEKSICKVSLDTSWPEILEKFEDGVEAAVVIDPQTEEPTGIITIHDVLKQVLVESAGGPLTEYLPVARALVRYPGALEVVLALADVGTVRVGDELITEAIPAERLFEVIAELRRANLVEVRGQTLWLTELGQRTVKRLRETLHRQEEGDEAVE